MVVRNMAIGTRLGLPSSQDFLSIASFGLTNVVCKLFVTAGRSLLDYKRLLSL